MERGKRIFHCTRCGACCSQLELFGPAYAHLDDGTGVCRHFDRTTRLCSVYGQRPLICRVEEGWEPFFRHMPHDEYVEKTEQVCRWLEEQMRMREDAALRP